MDAIVAGTVKYVKIEVYCCTQKSINLLAALNYRNLHPEDVIVVQN